MCVVHISHFSNNVSYKVGITRKQKISSHHWHTQSQLISSKGYPVEEYEVSTTDGYVLGIQRIPRGRNESGRPSERRKTPVFLQHGLLASSTDYVLNFPEQSLGFLLADAGYDVWLGNNRGTRYTRHKWLTRFEKEFWDFSADELSTIDLPAMLDFVLKKTGQKRLHYVGWSQGALMMFALLSERPAYNGKIKPPSYSLARTKVPVAIYWSQNDWLASETDVRHLRDDLPNVVSFYKVPDPQFTHIDFGWGCNATKILYEPMIKEMKKYGH
ncbi:lipase 3-like [Ixodes scapularis]|uniref:lipase 3-like n=1 Tax=Ixodes scapularis TaxID=6945 RepID=UPI001C39379E|nr:lipase 3-like [Ixodes scapularis]